MSDSLHKPPLAQHLWTCAAPLANIVTDESVGEAVQPTGRCYETGCRYHDDGESQNALSCAEHALLHGYIEHGLEFTQANKLYASNSLLTDHPPDTNVTLKLWPVVFADIQKLAVGRTPAQLVAIKACSGDGLGRLLRSV